MKQSFQLCSIKYNAALIVRMRGHGIGVFTFRKGYHSGSWEP